MAQRMRTAAMAFGASYDYRSVFAALDLEEQSLPHVATAEKARQRRKAQKRSIL